MLDIASFVLATAGGVDVVTRTTFAVRRLIEDWKDAPAQVLLLSHEIQQFEQVAKKLKEFSLSLEARPENEIYVTAITNLIQRAEPQWAELQKIIPSLTGRTGQTRKQKWMRVANKVTALRERLRSLRIATIEVLSIHTASQSIRIETSIATYQQNQQVWFNTADQHFSDIISRLEAPKPADDQIIQSLPLSNVSSDQNNGFGDHARENVPSQVTQGMWATIQHLHGPSNACSFSCRCKCHTGKKCGQLRIAPFDSILGSISLIFFGWKLMGPQCDVVSCHKARFKLFQVSYAVPWSPWDISIVASFSSVDGKPTIGVSLGPIINETNEYDKMGIISIVRGGNVPELKLMLQHRPGAVLDVSHRQGFSALHYAFQYASIDTINVLLAAGADPFYEDYQGAPAIYEGFLRMLQRPQDEEKLKDSLPTSVFFDDYGFSHLHRVVLGARPLGLQAELGSGMHSADINWRDDMNMTPLHWAALKGDDKAVAMLLAAGADVDVADSKKKTALHKACLIGSAATVKHLIEFGADVDVGDQYGYRPIHFAVHYNTGGALMSMLLANGAVIDDARNVFRRTPLIRAVPFDSARSCKFLLERGANVDIPDREGDTPLFEAAARNAHDCLELLLAWDADHLHVKTGRQTLLHIAATRGDKRTFDILANANLKGLDANAKDSMSMTVRSIFATRSGVSDETNTAFQNLMVSLAQVTKDRPEEMRRESEGDEEEAEFVDALESID
ncbi:MAG: hypothetical protein Q9172_001881 [Xanthocarpia lactea]